MGEPLGAEIPIYQSAVRGLHKRITVGFTDGQWTGEVLEHFDGGSPAFLDPERIMFSPIGNGPQQDDSHALIQGYGGPPFEWISSRRVWFPNDPDSRFAVEIRMQFPVVNPVYPQVVKVGCIEGSFGDRSDAATVVCQGSAYSIGDHVGKIALHSAGQDFVFEIPNDQAAHTLRVEWEPAITQIRVYWDGVLEHTEDAYPTYASAPRYWQIGMPHPVRQEFTDDVVSGIVEGLGTTDPPVPQLLTIIDYVKVDDDGGGYEAEAYPDWTTPDLGNDIDTAAEGELFEMDDIEWAIIPGKFIANADFGGTDREGVPPLSLTLTALDASGTDLFQDERWIGRPILIDTEMVSPAGTSSWRRLGCFEVQSLQVDGNTMTLTGQNRVLARFDTPLAISWNGETATGSAVGELDGVPRSYTLPEIIENVVDVADRWRGGKLGTTARDVQAPNFTPRILDNPGQSMLQWFLSLADRLVQEVFVQHTVSGAARYGMFRSHLWTFGFNDDPVWTFYGRGGANAADIKPPGPKLILTGRGPGQVLYRNNNPLAEIPPVGYGAEALTRSIFDIPLQALFPFGIYPDNGATVQDSAAEMSRAFDIDPVIGWPDRDGATVNGGIFTFRYWQERLLCRRVEFEVVNHDWPEVGMAITISDPKGRGITTAEKWVISSVHFRITSENELITTIGAVTTDLVKATDIYA